MSALDPPDSMYLEAAKGWLELGNHLEANEELERITPKLRAHPDVLEVRWRIHAHASRLANVPGGSDTSSDRF